MGLDKSLLGEKGVNLPVLTKTIDYCQLHQTTKEEAYRKIALDNLTSQTQIIDFYNALIATPGSQLYEKVLEMVGGDAEAVKGLIGMMDDSAGEIMGQVEEVISLVTNPIKTEEMDAWKYHCLNTRKPCGGCKDARHQLEKLYEQRQETMYNSSQQLVDIIFPFIEKAAKQFLPEKEMMQAMMAGMKASKETSSQ